MPVDARLLGRTRAELEDIAAGRGWPRYRGRQLAEWIYGRHCAEFRGMTNLALADREALAQEWQVGRAPPQAEAVSADGTKKYLFATPGGLAIETVAIPDEDRVTLCLSSQAGCRYGCRFCRTGRQGWHGNLEAADILNQYAACPERDHVTNIVFMGMGEPLDNLDPVLRSLEAFTADWGYAMSPTRLTVSTVGLLPQLQTYLDKCHCHLALSLHSPFPDERRQFMPVEALHPLEEILRVLRAADFSGQRRLTFEYAMLAGVNDTLRHAAALAKLLAGLACRVNLIALNPFPGSEFQPASREVMEAFQQELKRHGLMTTIRKSKGQDIAAACGLLAAPA